MGPTEETEGEGVEDDGGLVRLALLTWWISGRALHSLGWTWTSTGHSASRRLTRYL